MAATSDPAAANGVQQAANDARYAVQQSADQLQQKASQRSTILAQVDQMRMQQKMAASINAVTGLTQGNKGAVLR